MKCSVPTCSNETVYIKDMSCKEKAIGYCEEHFILVNKNIKKYKRLK
jgi:hypothetical protein